MGFESLGERQILLNEHGVRLYLWGGSAGIYQDFGGCSHYMPSDTHVWAKYVKSRRLDSIEFIQLMDLVSISSS